MVKIIFSFDDKSARKLKNKRNVLGGKGANLGEMGRLGLPVPPGFTITTNVCDLFYKNKKKLPKKVIKNSPKKEFSPVEGFLVKATPVEHSSPIFPNTIA